MNTKKKKCTTHQTVSSIRRIKPNVMSVKNDILKTKKESNESLGVNLLVSS